MVVALKTHLSYASKGLYDILVYNSSEIDGPLD